MADNEGNEHRFASFAVDATAGLDSIDTAIRTIVGYAEEILGTRHAGVTLRQAGGRLRSVGTTNAIVEEADRLQYEFGEGPCVQAALDSDSHVLLSADVSCDERWPRWGPATAELGLRSVLSTELAGQQRAFGALNIYGDQVRQFTDRELATAHLFSAHATLALAAAASVQTLSEALDTRTRIGQAQGILMTRFGLDEAQAFAVLRRYSQTTNRKLREVADILVSSGDLPPLSQSPDS